MADQFFLKHLDTLISDSGIKWKTGDHDFYVRLISNAANIKSLYHEIYGHHQKQKELFDQLILLIIKGYKDRGEALKKRDEQKEQEGKWFLSNQLVGMSLYVDQFCGTLKELPGKFGYLKDLGINFLHLMPLFESPPDASDGGYAVSDFRAVNTKFGDLSDLKEVQHTMLKEDMYLMLDIVLNHTSEQHEWARKAAAGEKFYQDYYYMYDDRNIPDHYDKTMPDIFPETSPGNFTFIASCNKWVMSVFHHYQWDLNYTNPQVFISMLDNIFFYANLGVDVLRIDAPAFIWKKTGTTSQNLPEAHTILRLIKICVETATPGMALLGEAIVAPDEIMKYFGTGMYTAKECDFAYNATLMALQWDAMATGDTRVLQSGQDILQQKPFETSWITYTRCHDDIGLGYTDQMISSAGFDPYQHREFIKNYYSGNYSFSSSTGALFSYNPKTGDARISGTLASLCGLEKAVKNNDEAGISLSIKKILLMQAMSLFVGGLPILFYGDEVGYTNDTSYLNDAAKSYDNRWMHRPVIDWEKNKKKNEAGTVENKVYLGIKKLISVRKKFTLISDFNNISWLPIYNNHVTGFVRTGSTKDLYCLFNFSNEETALTLYVLKANGLKTGDALRDEMNSGPVIIEADHEYLTIAPYGFYLLST